MAHDRRKFSQRYDRRQQMEFVAASPRLPLKLLRTSRYFRSTAIGKRSIIISSKGAARKKIAVSSSRIYIFSPNYWKFLMNLGDLFPSEEKI